MQYQGNPESGRLSAWRSASLPHVLFVLLERESGGADLVAKYDERTADLEQFAKWKTIRREQIEYAIRLEQL